MVHPVVVGLGGEPEMVGERRLVHHPGVLAHSRVVTGGPDPYSGGDHGGDRRAHRVVRDEQPVEHRSDSEAVPGESAGRRGVLAVAARVEDRTRMPQGGSYVDGPLLRLSPQPVADSRSGRVMVGIDIDRVAATLAARPAPTDEPAMRIVDQPPVMHRVEVRFHQFVGDLGNGVVGPADDRGVVRRNQFEDRWRVRDGGRAHGVAGGQRRGLLDGGHLQMVAGRGPAGD